jgi:inner membrane protein
VASVGHIAVGLAAARSYERGQRPGWPAMVAWSALSLLPDIDVAGFLRGVPYGAPWGHRGATHSLTLAIAGGVAVGVAARWFTRPFARTAAFAIAVLASHGLLDAMTDGGLGAALLWPFSLTRFFAPWQPIPVAPIGPAFFTIDGATIAAVEVILFLPLFLYAVRVRLRPSLIAVWAVGVWLAVSSDPVREKIVGLALHDHTVFAREYSEAAFRTVTVDESEDVVRRRLGEPLRENLYFMPKESPFQSAMEISPAQFPRACLGVFLEANVVRDAVHAEGCRSRGVTIGLSKADVNRALGEPSESCMDFSRGADGGHFRMRMVCFLHGKVEAVFRRWV